MPSVTQLARSISFMTVLLAEHIAGACFGDKPIALCCMGLAPFYTNQYVWGGICGYTPSSPNELIGGVCIEINGACPLGTIGTCCAGTFAGPSGECGLGTNCGTPTQPGAPPVQPAPIPVGWTTDFACSSDSGPRVIANDKTTQLSNNTPANCIALCSSQGYIFAGVEYSDECHCGTGYKTSPAPSAIDPSNCNMRCTGNDSYTCGGSFAIQLYHGPAPPDPLPLGWAEVDACAVDVPSRVIIGDVTTQLSYNTPGQCASFCAEQGYTYAGVEYGDECHCGTGIAPDLQAAPTSDCNIPCTGSNGLLCGGSWRIQIYAQS